jgi:hypothetical protein
VIEAHLVITRALAVYRALVDAGIDCEIGGALALGYHVDDPRTTRDIDVNVGLNKSDAARALAALPDEVPWDNATLAAIERDGQVRIMWPVPEAAALPLDLFFAEHRLHAVAHERAVSVPMAGATVHILSATDLTIFKALFNRPKDWVDIQAMLDAHDSSVDLAEAARWVGAIVGESDPRARKLLSLRE